MGRLDGKVAIVTGASRGIGEEIARLFAAEGARVVCTARTLREGEHRLEGSLETTVASIRADGGEATAVAANLALPEECRRVVEETHAAYGPIDVLVNNAALAYFQPIASYPMNRWLRTWDVNVHATFVLSQLALEDMVPRRSGSIVTISSAAAVGPGSGPYTAAPEFRNSTAYGAQKAALERFTQGLAQEVFQHGVSVTCVAPSQVVPTPGTVYHGLVTGRDDPSGEAPDLMAKAVLLLATEPAEKVTGRVVYSQQLLREYGLIAEARGTGVDPARPGTGYSRA